MFQFFAAAVLAASPAPDLPRYVAQPDSALDQCLAAEKPDDDALVYVSTCYSAAYDRADGAVNKQLDDLWARMANDGIADKDARDAMVAWHDYRDRWCRFEGEGEADPNSRGMTELMCRVELTQRLLARLGKAYQR
jgi:uncharacterized protein YecT (DUF1311 family)